MDDDDRLLLPRMCLGGWFGSSPRLGTSEFSFVAGQTTGGPQNALGNPSD